MTLTLEVGSSGSGKTTFLNQIHERLKHSNGTDRCIYLRQYHTVRPYIPVAKIPHFDPTQLPYWSVYEKEGTAGTIPVGGTLAGTFTPGLSGGQRKLFLFELIRQRTVTSLPVSSSSSSSSSSASFRTTRNRLLILLDEPFAGVTDDLVPFVEKQLQELGEQHNVVIVTNDYVNALARLSHYVLEVSARDRTLVNVWRRRSSFTEQPPQEQQQKHGLVDREQVLQALVSTSSSMISLDTSLSVLLVDEEESAANIQPEEEPLSNSNQPVPASTHPCYRQLLNKQVSELIVQVTIDKP